jgi:hypothetical protein
VHNGDPATPFWVVQPGKVNHIHTEPVPVFSWQHHSNQPEWRDCPPPGESGKWIEMKLLSTKPEAAQPARCSSHLCKVQDARQTWKPQTEQLIHKKHPEKANPDTTCGSSVFQACHDCGMTQRAQGFSAGWWECSEIGSWWGCTAPRCTENHSTVHFAGHLMYISELPKRIVTGKEIRSDCTTFQSNTLILARRKHCNRFEIVQKKTCNPEIYIWPGVKDTNSFKTCKKSEPLLLWIFPKEKNELPTTKGIRDIENRPVSGGVTSLWKQNWCCADVVDRGNHEKWTWDKQNRAQPFPVTAELWHCYSETVVFRW